MCVCLCVMNGALPLKTPPRQHCASYDFPRKKYIKAGSLYCTQYYHALKAKTHEHSTDLCKWCHNHVFSMSEMTEEEKNTWLDTKPSTNRWRTEYQHLKRLIWIYNTYNRALWYSMGILTATWTPSCPASVNTLDTERKQVTCTQLTVGEPWENRHYPLELCCGGIIMHIMCCLGVKPFCG